jgi:hypothetical protein
MFIELIYFRNIQNLTYDIKVILYKDQYTYHHPREADNGHIVTKLMSVDSNYLFTDTLIEKLQDTINEALSEINP